MNTILLFLSCYSHKGLFYIRRALRSKVGIKLYKLANLRLRLARSFVRIARYLKEIFIGCVTSPTGSCKITLNIYEKFNAPAPHATRRADSCASVAMAWRLTGRRRDLATCTGEILYRNYDSVDAGTRTRRLATGVRATIHLDRGDKFHSKVGIFEEMRPKPDDSAKK